MLRLFSTQIMSKQKMNSFEVKMSSMKAKKRTYILYHVLYGMNMGRIEP
jgi:hypothetical protein